MNTEALAPPPTALSSAALPIPLPERETPPVPVSVPTPSLSHLVPTVDPIMQHLSSQNTFWTSIKAAFTQKTQTERDLEVFYTLGSDKRIPTLIDALNVEGHPRIQLLLRPIIRQLATEASGEFQNLLKEVAKKVIEDKASPFLLLNCLSMLTLQELETVLKEFLSTESPLDAQLKEMAKVEKILTEGVLPKETSPKAAQEVFPLPKIVCELIETILNAFSFFQIGKDPGGSWEASHLLTVYGRIIAFPLLLITALNVIMSAAAALITTLAILLLVIGVLTAYLKWFRPCPTNIFPCDSLTDKAQAGTLDPVFGRNWLIGRVNEDLKASIPVLLVGETGSGKTSIANAIALKALGTGVVVLSVNCKDLEENLTISGGPSKLTRLIDHIKPFNDQIFLFLDEFHSIIGTPLQALLRTKLKELRHVFAATTTHGYDALVKSDKSDKGELVRRFLVRDVPSTNQHQTLLILRDIAHRLAPDLDISDEILVDIFKRTQELVQPDGAKQLLESAITQTRFNNPATTSEIELADQVEQFTAASSRYKHGMLSGKSELEKSRASLQTDEEAISKAATAVSASKKTFAELQRLRALKVKQEDLLFKLALELSRENSAEATERLKKQALFTMHFMIKTIEATMTTLKSGSDKLPSITMETLNQLKPVQAPSPVPPTAHSVHPSPPTQSAFSFATAMLAVASPPRSQHTPKRPNSTPPALTVFRTPPTSKQQHSAFRTVAETDTNTG